MTISSTTGCRRFQIVGFSSPYPCQESEFMMIFVYLGVTSMLMTDVGEKKSQLKY